MSVKKEISSLDRALKCAEYALDKKAYEVKILEIARLSSIADYLVIASGTSDKQVQAIAESVRTGLKKFGKPLDIEGLAEGKWVVIDYGDVLFHVFIEELRSYYDLDGLWQVAPQVEIPEKFLWETKGA
ncbi:ribosome silencing factor [Geobacter pelophilus]|uniref:Ribosomal silencing factor RsfS n=1 Tax=Geoanaerobacter pelophilus TaxID=60036 RepID=A0AAW4L6E2_9BACT|nr:ribosome silencing factor [Geoanaerobacter pelophilus]MBT0663771.1 ribosome silencing factor [Geoanaerobacter pelophilus]